MPRLCAPDGTPIYRLDVTIRGYQVIDPEASTARGPDGRFILEIDDTDTDWDGVNPVMQYGERLFEDEDGKKWAESQLMVKDDDDDDDE